MLVVQVLGNDVDDDAAFTVGVHLAPGAHVVDEAFWGGEDETFPSERGLVDRRTVFPRRGDAEVGVLRHPSSPSVGYTSATIVAIAPVVDLVDPCPGQYKRMVAGGPHQR